MSRVELPPEMVQLHAQGHLRDVDFFLADALRRTYGIESPEVLLGAALASRVIADAHVCLPLTTYGGIPWPPADSENELNSSLALHPIFLPSLDSWVGALKASDACYKPVPGTPEGARTAHGCPLVLVEDPEPRLYLARYYRYEQQVVERLLGLATEAPAALSDVKRDELIRVLFPEPEDEMPRKAAAAALNRRLLIISGGPGTGKTYTVARLLALLTEGAREQGRELLIRMAAPTGKAAMRMRESIRRAKHRGLRELSEQQRAGIPDDACTLHRLLGSRRASPHFKHNAEYPLPADVVIVDEASMIDLPLMARLLDALPPHARLILLGDMNQLSSIEPGFVLGDICAAARDDSPAPLNGSLVELTHSWRFPADGAIGQLSSALQSVGNEADPSGALAWATLQELSARAPPDDPEETWVRWRDTPVRLRDGDRRPWNDLRELVLKGYTPFLDAETPQAAFNALEEFRILSPRRRGPHGIGTLNLLVEEILSLKNMKPGPGESLPPRRRLRPGTQFYDHRVIIITRNDYGLGLFNGDIGVVLAENADGRTLEADAAPRRVAWFETVDHSTGTKGYRPLPCSMLPEHETAFAMTVHKSQGSQFRDLLIIIPPEGSPLLCRELLYTALTRAERSVHLWCGETAFRSAAVHRVERSGGLRIALSQRL